MHSQTEPLKTNLVVLKLLCMYPVDSKTGVLTRVAFITFTTITLAVLAITDIGSAVFFWKHLSIDLIKALQGMAQAILVFNALYTCLILFYARHQVKAMLDKLTDIYNASKKRIEFSENSCKNILKHNFSSGLDSNVESFKFLNEANSQSEWMWQTYFRIMTIATIIIASFFLLSLLNCYLNETFNVKCFSHPVTVV